jgi:hypothetical protein
MPELFRWDVDAWDNGHVWGPIPGQTPYLVQVDINRDLGFALNLDAYSLQVDAQYGFMDPYTDTGLQADVADPAEMRVQLFNREGAFLPEKSTALFYGLLKRGQLVRFQVEDAEGEIETVFVGRLKQLNVTPGKVEDPIATLIVTDINDDLLTAEFAPKLQTNVRVDEVLAPLFERPAVPWPYASSFFLLDIEGSGELDETARLYENTLTDFEEAYTTLAWAGDNNGNENGVSAQGFIRETMPAEAGGRFFYDASRMKYVFHNRAHDTLYEGEVYAFSSDDFLAGYTRYVYMDNLINALTATFQARKRGAPGTKVWEYPNLPWSRGPGNTEQKQTIRFSDPDYPGARVAVVDGLPPQAYVDYEAVDELLPTPHDDYTARASVTLVWYADRAEMTTRTQDTGTMHFIKLQARATTLILLPPEQVSHSDPYSIAAYERIEAGPLDLRAVADAEFAEQVVKFIVNRYKEPQARFAQVSFFARRSAETLDHGLRRRIGDHIRITSERLGHDSEYVIVGIAHNVVAASGTHLVTWALLPFVRTSYFRLDMAGLAELDETARLFL